ncbi:BgtAc-30332 [Blumeria graminis f. sp. tritici]|uniref:BgtAc-30332 n=3 Tax=Blumeria graminis TaxID=34373 RepID=A0A9X9PS00_BLUGR|nr:hypothetical protein BGT96224_Ac30332 [Blumeria graminis f. sp. tritici 96224]VCU40887.1 BgtAc-30332 [Blumeria graminis f. sp. tritici]
MYSTMIKRVIIITFMGIGLVEDITGSPLTAKIQHSTGNMAELKSRGTSAVGATVLATVFGNALGGILSPKFVELGKKHAENAEKKKNKSQESLDEDNPRPKKSKSKEESSSSVEPTSRKEDKEIAEADNLSSKDSVTSGVAKAKPLRRRNGAKIRSLRRRRLNSSKVLKGSSTAVGTVGTTALGAAVFNYFFAKKEAENQIKTDKEAKKKSKEDDTSKSGSDDSPKDKPSEKTKDDSTVNTKSEPSGQVTADKPRTELGQDDKQKLAGPL